MLFAVKRLSIMFIASAAITGCASGSTSPGPLAELWYYAHSQPVQFKGSIDNLVFELNGRTEKPSQKIVMSALVRGSKSYDYFVEVESNGNGNVEQCVVTRAAGGSMSNYFGTLTKFANAIQPKEATVFSCLADYSNRNLHELQIGDAVSSVKFKMQSIP